jgi:hypothetical protein
MDQSGLILDYASPRKRSKFRLASASLLRWQWEDAGLVVREWLDGQARAKVAIIATLIMLGIAGFNTWLFHEHTPTGMLIFLGTLIGLGLALVPVIIQQSWRETLLTIGWGTIALKMGGPLASRSFSWRFEEVEAIRVIALQMQEGAPVLGELEILAQGTPPIRLFTDHEERRLANMAAEIERAIRPVGSTAEQESNGR